MHYTVITRIIDNFPLCASMLEKSELEPLVRQAKFISKNMTNASERRCHIESGNYMFHYILEEGICYLTLTDKSYPKRLALDYLEELHKEFFSLYKNELDTTSRPFPFMRFENFIQKTKKLYMDTRNHRNLQKLNNELQDVHRIMTKNIEEVLDRGQKLDNVSQMSSRLTSETRKYAATAKTINQFKVYWPAVVLFVVICAAVYFFKFR
eukprot:TRINITY_DN51_c0_g1::TRINITY_DN51_c0_g1_i1::g.14772::m.14772 TRINITY_DN51_c0_g1::TRINITY_DN51_c0_g1_i1::g.14772  ORF type:complete len:209 (+),score=33.37,sp/Q94AU2/SEC22_ARATH/45.81/1e-58,Longin/PF13774.1/6.7e-24,Longin/PF13774.1/2.2e+02,Synaptobrevin/PF00957.16/2.5e+03,Synaptobrevin/PF00957.16/1.3e-15,T4SS/PF07996.6/0.026,CRISPR_assoc/PF08798.6/0.06 TRINITY_DN51_c0_g1_i1:87-713(+)